MVYKYFLCFEFLGIKEDFDLFLGLCILFKYWKVRDVGNG